MSPGINAAEQDDVFPPVIHPKMSARRPSDAEEWRPILLPEMVMRSYSQAAEYTESPIPPALQRNQSAKVSYNQTTLQAIPLELDSYNYVKMCAYCARKYIHVHMYMFIYYTYIAYS